MEQDFISSNFPFERLWVELDGLKVTGSPRTAFEQYWEAKVARKLYRGKHMTNKYEFNLVWWDGVKKVIYEFTKMFHFLSLSIPTIILAGIINSLALMIRWKNVCSSCGKEDALAKHITRCRYSRRREMWRILVQELASWAGATTSYLVLCNTI